ncbi:apolipoprotein N-acyltransferase [Rhodococcus sp. BP-252]|uniref:apolipoprotein N-acyltransferase n=1 Tax=unclassified Rhodococcus (in: high G+C Gram-positive bacteria) TaxID=192944 RepID=UPI001C9B2234|nr:MULTISPECIES: apolipoprotein N-acyltransferase [unclassified Rhodococcus (in: high G+C Gram-positive bacteria)]MBY6413911.1 apolipoprotein N-acyltransferase [Rhodococcus sp. BP-320]MBY6418639.1 apolipoprotein N-acyltransferase [Rhodococcus sp. BP-321]MBY6422934.1 apolipoprotein N-acyltransferase [Rhodococcus sp. BP-324]MBY6428717.1 apolipoprotein N-acyltransferase [Rhodococcus sp. BP-323]MBY6433760.1 apolipoprotein N-acyltransferase [Rhodococcus sp. BP-322]
MIDIDSGATTVNRHQRTRRRRTFTASAIRSSCAIAAGLLLFASFPPRSLWFLAPLGIGILVLVVRGRSVRASLFYGYLSGLAFFLPLLPWVGVYVGAPPWLALAAIQAIAVALFCAAVAAVSGSRLDVLWIAAIWTATEGLRARIPFGGFPWGRLAFAQADGPLLSLAAFVGAPGVSFAVALIGAALAAVVGQVRPPRLRVSVGSAATVVIVPALAFALTPDGDTAAARATVAVVQGNVPRLGLDFNSQRRAVLDNHIERTMQLGDDIAAGRVPTPDLVIWPENASDIDPLRNADASAGIDAAAQSIGVPILVGAVLSNDDGTSTNTSIVWDPVLGPGERHDKRKLVPFGEYLPMRSVMTKLSSYASQAGNFVPGSGNGVVDVAGIPTAVATCYEVAFDDLVTESVRAGATLITVPTNNATFGRTDMTYQQLAMSRLRAVEHNRTVLVAATSGVSAVIDPQGNVRDRSGLFTGETLVADVALESTMTWATRVGALPEYGAVILAVIGCALAYRRRHNSAHSPQLSPVRSGP